MQFPRSKTTFPICRSLYIAALCLPSVAGGQTVHAPNVLQQTSAAQAYARFDAGELSPASHLRRMRVVLAQSMLKRNALQSLLDQQQDRHSDTYHRWISPDEYGRQFGSDPEDIAKVVQWLSKNGTEDIEVSNGNNFISFSTSVAHVEQMLHVELHRYRVQGEDHYANTLPPVLPDELRGMVALIQGLDDFTPKAPHHLPRKSAANFIYGSGVESLGPGDLATIYDVNPLYKTGMDGSRSTIAIVGAAAPPVADVAAYRQLFGLPVNNFTTVVVPGSEAGGSSGTASLEAALDLEVAGGIAPQAKLLYVEDDDVIAAVAYVVDKKLAQIVSMSYTACELPGPEDFAYETLALQAVAEGITWVNASGDSGAAACDAAGSAAATSGLAVNLPASIPEVTGVGGTSFTGGSQYWTQSNGAIGTTALGYVPETAWNAASEGLTVTAGGGGVSKDFFKPGYQSSFDDGVLFRETPDVSLDAGEGSPPYLIVAGGEVLYVGGTSAATPLFAGITALVNDYLAANGAAAEGGGLGNINPELYRLQQSDPAVFHDVTSGSNKVACAASSVDCTDGSLGYDAAAGYDMATGLGSVDAYKLASGWANADLGISTVTLAAGNVDSSGLVTLTATVNAAENPAPGIVIFSWTSAAYLNVPTDFARVVVGDDGVASTTFGGLPNGADLVTATFQGTTALLGSVSSAIAVNVTRGGAPTASVALLDAQAEVPAGAYLPLSATVVGTGIPPTGTVGFYLGDGLMGSAAVVDGVAMTLSSALPAAGVDVLTAKYSGDATYAGVVSAPFSIRVVTPTAAKPPPSQPPPDFSLTAPSSMTVAAGSSASFGLTIAPLHGFGSAIQFACSGAVTGYSCSPPATITPNGSVTVMANLQVQLAAFLPFLTPFLIRRRASAKLRGMSFILTGLACLLLTGCGYHVNRSAAASGAGSYPVTITASSGTIVHTAVVTVNVQ